MHQAEHPVEVRERLGQEPGRSRFRLSLVWQCGCSSPSVLVFGHRCPHPSGACWWTLLSGPSFRRPAHLQKSVAGSLLPLSSNTLIPPVAALTFSAVSQPEFLVFLTSTCVVGYSVLVLQSCLAAKRLLSTVALLLFTSKVTPPFSPGRGRDSALYPKCTWLTTPKARGPISSGESRAPGSVVVPCCQGLKRLGSDPATVCLLSRVVTRFTSPLLFVLRLPTPRNSKFILKLYCSLLDYKLTSAVPEQPQRQKGLDVVVPCWGLGCVA